MHLNPTEYFIHTFGGLSPAALSINRTPSAVCQWRKAGTIPTGAMREIILAAKARGLDLTTDDLVFGRKITLYKRKA
jgi:hypothetical protein